MQPNGGLNPGFITVEDAVKLIKADKRDKATVDLQFLVNNIPYLKEKHNYNIRLLESDEKGYAHYTGEVFVNLTTRYDKELLLKTIVDAYTERTGVALNADTLGINKVTSMVDEEQGALDGRPRFNPDSKIKVKDDISQPYTQVLENVD